MNGMNERLIELRKTLGFKTQQAWADDLNLKRGTIANYEIGRNEPIDAVITLICNKYNVNEPWLRNGEGEMFKPVTMEEELIEFTRDLLVDEKDSFKKRLVSALARLSEEQWDLLEDIIDEISQKKE